MPAARAVRAARHALRLPQAVCQKLPLKDLIADEEATIGNPNARPRSRSPHKEKESTPKSKAAPAPQIPAASLGQQWDAGTADMVCGVRRAGSAKVTTRHLSPLVPASHPTPTPPAPLPSHTRARK